METERTSLFSDLINWLKLRRTGKENDLWVFGAIRGTRYADNAKYFFEYVNRETDIRAVWISRKHEVVDRVRSEGYTAYLDSSAEAMEACSRAAVAIVTHRGHRNEADIPMHYLSDRTKIIQLWHGIPLKKIAYDDRIFSFRHDEGSIYYKLKTVVKRSFFPFLDYINHPALIPALSEETRNLFSRAFRVSEEKVVISGYPRNDLLLRHTKNFEENAPKRVIYMPTFRGEFDSGFDLFLRYGFQTDEMDRFLRDNGMRLDIKLHPFNHPSDRLMQALERAENISLLDQSDIYERLHEYAVLITDYSSIYFDYLLLDRPVVFAPFDKESYIKSEREFYFDYEEVTPGPKADNWQEVMRALKRCIDDPSLYAEERAEIRDRFHTYRDDGSSRRLYEMILTLLEHEGVE